MSSAAETQAMLEYRQAQANGVPEHELVGLWVKVLDAIRERKQQFFNQQEAHDGSDTAGA